MCQLGINTFVSHHNQNKCAMWHLIIGMFGSHISQNRHPMWFLNIGTLFNYFSKNIHAMWHLGIGKLNSHLNHNIHSIWHQNIGQYISHVQLIQSKYTYWVSPWYKPTCQLGQSKHICNLATKLARYLVKYVRIDITNFYSQHTFNQNTLSQILVLNDQSILIQDIFVHYVMTEISVRKYNIKPLICSSVYYEIGFYLVAYIHGLT